MESSPRGRFLPMRAAAPHPSSTKPSSKISPMYSSSSPASPFIVDSYSDSSSDSSTLSSSLSSSSTTVLAACTTGPPKRNPKKVAPVGSTGLVIRLALDLPLPERELLREPAYDDASSSGVGRLSLSQCARANAPLVGRIGSDEMSTSTRPTQTSPGARRSTVIAPPLGSIAMNCRVEGPHVACSFGVCGAGVVVAI